MRLSLILGAAASAVPALLVAQSSTPSRNAAASPPAVLATASPVARAAAPMDSAISQLEGFLTRYPNSALRPNALFQLGELLVRRADEQFAQQQRGTGAGDSTARSDAPVRPNYAPAIARYEELVRRYPTFAQGDAAAYTLGTLYAQTQRYADAARMFDIVTARDSSRFRNEGYFRLGDAYFELAAQARGDARRAQFAQAATAYEKAVANAPTNGDIYFLSLYKLGWSYYNQATTANSDAYNKAVDVFGRLVDAYDKLTPEQQNRLGLRGEAVEYMAVAFTQVGGADAANKYFTTRGGADYKLPILRRVAQNLRDQGSFPQAIDAYRVIQQDAPNDSGSLAIQKEIVDIYQNRTIQPDSAQAARLALVERYAPMSQWAQANPTLSGAAARAREDALRQSAQYELARAQGGQRQRYADAEQLYARYLGEFPSTDSSQAANTYYAEALLGQGKYLEAGSQYSRAAYSYSGRQLTPVVDSAAAAADTSARRAVARRDTVPLAQRAGQNAIVAFDSALTKNKTDAATQDSLFAAVDHYVAAFPNSPVAKDALKQKGRRASETKRWDVMAQTFRTYAQTYPNDAYTPTAQKLVADALFRGGSYTEAQSQYDVALTTAQQSGRRALADSILSTRTAAAGIYADTLVKQGQYKRAAEEVYVAYADKNPQNAKAPDALRDAIETYMIVVDSARQKGLSDNDVTDARNRAIELSNRLITQYPSYKYRAQYQALNARLLADAGRRDEAITALRQVVADLPKGTAQADARVRLAVALDSAGQKKEAAAAYEEFSAAYPTDKRGADAQFNAAVTYAEAQDQASAARAFGTFASRYPRDSRAAEARERRVASLRQSGDSTTAATEVARLCSSSTASAAVKAECSASMARRLFNGAVATFARYQQERLVIPTIGQLTRAGVTRASARKQALLKQLNGELAATIRTGNPEYLAAATYYLGLAQYEYGEFLKNVSLPQGLTDDQRTAAQNGSTQQAQQYYDAAKKSWQALVDKADQTPELKNDAAAAQWVQKARDGVEGKVDSSAPGAE